MTEEVKDNDCFEYDEHTCNPRWPHKVVISREISENDNPWGEDELTEEVLYQGNCRSYRKSLTSYKENVLTNVRMLSIKGALKGLKTNDIVKVDRFGYKEVGYVKDVNIYMNGRGTTIEWDYERV